jgi:hypothetical protein
MQVTFHYTIAQRLICIGKVCSFYLQNCTIEKQWSPNSSTLGDADSFCVMLSKVFKQVTLNFPIPKPLHYIGKVCSKTIHETVCEGNSVYTLSPIGQHDKNRIGSICIMKYKVARLVITFAAASNFWMRFREKKSQM